MFVTVFATICCQLDGNIILRRVTKSTIGGVDMGEVANLLSSGQYLTALQVAGEQARNPSNSTQQRITAAISATEAALELGMYQEARSFARLALEQSETQEQQAQATYYYGVALLETDVAESESVLLHALTMDNMEFIQHRRPILLYNLALAYQRLRHDNMAVAVYQQAGAAFVQQARLTDAAAAYQNAAWLALLCRDATTGRQMLSQASECTDGTVPGENAKQQALTAYACLLSGDGAGALSLVQSVLSDERSVASPWARALAFATAAELALQDGHNDMALNYVRTAQDHAIPTKNVRLLNLLTTLRQRCA